MVNVLLLPKKKEQHILHVTGNSVGISYYTKSPAGQEHTAAKRDYVAGAARRRRRILQVGFLKKNKDTE